MDINYWKGKNVFVTGGSGFFGSWLVEKLIELKSRVVVIVRDYAPEFKFFAENLANRVCVVRGVIEDFYLVERILNEYEIEVVFHLAAQTIVPIANNNPLSTFESNIKGSWVLLDACRRNKRVKKIIVVSSDKAYGEKKELPYVEDMPLEGRNPYDVSKSCADLISQMYFHHYNLPICIMRCANLFGGGDLNFSRLIPGTIRSAYYDERPIIRSNGKYIRDYLYIKDAVMAIILLAEKMDEVGIVGHAFNFSNELRLTVLDVVKRILKLMNKEYLEPIILDEAKGEIVNQYLSTEKARRMLGWSPMYNFDDALVETIEWYKRYFQLNP